MKALRHLGMRTPTMSHYLFPSLAFCLLALTCVEEAQATDHVLAITISDYTAGASVGPLAGVIADRANALAIAARLGFDTTRAVQMQDRQATIAGIRNAFEQLRLSVSGNDRVFVYYSGHGGTKRVSNTCQSSLVTYDDEDLLSSEFFVYIDKIKAKAPKQVFVLLDSCHSGDFTERVARSKGDSTQTSRPKMRTRLKNGEPPCNAPINDIEAKLRAANRTRLATKGTTNEELGGQLVVISAAQHNEVAWDSELGGMATTALLRCLVEPKFASAEGSGFVSADALGQCAQATLNLEQSEATRQHVAVFGQTAAPLLPAWGANASGANASQTLEALAQNSDSSWRVSLQSSVAETWKGSVDSTFRPGAQRMRIGSANRLQVAVQSDRAGYLYLVYASHDSNQFALLFPTEKENFLVQVSAGQPYLIPRRWPARGNGGRPERDTILAIVAEQPIPQLQKFLKGGAEPATPAISQGLASATSACKSLGVGEDQCIRAPSPKLPGTKQLGDGEEHRGTAAVRYGAARFIFEEY